MKKSTIRNISIILIILSVIGSALGGYIDMTGKEFPVSRDHLWRDSLWLLTLAVLLNVMYK